MLLDADSTATPAKYTYLDNLTVAKLCPHIGTCLRLPNPPPIREFFDIAGTKAGVI
jgi:hypothetical protein